MRRVYCVKNGYLRVDALIKLYDFDIMAYVLKDSKIRSLKNSIAYTYNMIYVMVKICKYGHILFVF